MHVRVRFLAVMLVAFFAGACGSSDPAPACASGLPATCAPLYEPTFANVFTKTLHPTCAQSGASCHSAEGAQGGLVYDDADTAYALLLGQKDGRARVKPGDAACSLLVERIEATDSAQAMPPGAKLSGPERCGIEQWIRDGAKR